MYKLVTFTEKNINFKSNYLIAIILANVKSIIS